jgi:hypothetical protein
MLAPPIRNLLRDVDALAVILASGNCPCRFSGVILLLSSS